MDALSTSYNQFELTIDRRAYCANILQQAGFFSLGWIYILMISGIGLMEIMGIRLIEARSAPAGVNG